MKCDMNCFACQLEDCVQEELTQEEISASKSRDNYAYEHMPADPHTRWQRVNKDKISDYSHKSYIKYREKHIERRKKYYEENRERIIAARRQSYHDNKEKLRREQLERNKNSTTYSEYQKKYREEHREQHKQYMKEYKERKKAGVLQAEIRT